jgi:hypothetical protein
MIEGSGSRRPKSIRIRRIRIRIRIRNTGSETFISDLPINQTVALAGGRVDLLPGLHRHTARVPGALSRGVRLHCGERERLQRHVPRAGHL